MAFEQGAGGAELGEDLVFGHVGSARPMRLGA